MGIHENLKLTKKKRRRNGKLIDNSKQGYCNICQSKTKSNFSQGLDNIFEDEKEVICLEHADNGTSNFFEHMTRENYM